ncbi:sigma-54 dependent transcriptional regulator [Azospirillum sp. TSO22-1]|uniref:sigma-54-dependent transcriptional regulator n=1 Tax=Azospirillum sp. TSO22-1 TaxID=716789 RepID=UPI000D6598C1|nr:sigma-54 dependent transcriptional regulator [Azospirillum sp. TSO22-1]
MTVLPPPQALLIDDEEEVLYSQAQTLELEGIATITALVPDEGLSRLSRSWYGVVVADVRMPGRDGFSVLDEVRTIDPELPVLMVTGHGDIAMAIRAIRQGAYDFIEKPADPDHLVETIRRAFDHRRLVLENRALRDALNGADTLEMRIIGRSAAMERLRATLIALAEAEADVLIHGETGTGKELVARSLHDFSRRRSRNFVAINCGALPDTILESELFGHEAGAFTGAQSRRIGKLEHANGGTLFLDEIESMPMHVQVRLLRVLQERTIERLGSNQQIPLDMRVVAATKADLRDLFASNKFREDLYYRLAVAHIQIPPLRERREDIPLLLRYFVELAAERNRRAPPLLTSEFLFQSQAKDWPGNVRELRNAAERVVLGIGEGGTMPGGPSADAPLVSQIELFERYVIETSLARNYFKIGETAEKLGISRKTLYLKMRQYGLEHPKQG